MSLPIASCDFLEGKGHVFSTLYHQILAQYLARNKPELLGWDYVHAVLYEPQSDLET